MKKTTKILFPTDFSEAAANAFRYAIKLAGKIGANIEVLNVVTPQPGPFDFPVVVDQVTKQLMEANRVRLKRFVEEGMTQTFQNIKEAPGIIMNMEVGVPATTIIEIAKRDAIGLIIMGTRGENKSRIEKFLGNVAEAVVQKAPCSVMVIPESGDYKEHTSIAYATEIVDADAFKIWKSVEILQAFNATIQCVHFDFKKNGDLTSWEKMGELKTFFEKQNPELKINFHHLPGHKIEDDLNRFAEAYNVNLIIMYQPKHNMWERIFQKSTTKNMAVHTHVPLMVLK